MYLDVAAEVVGRVSFPGIDHAALAGRPKIDGVEDGRVELTDVQAALIGAQGKATNEGAHLCSTGNSHLLKIELADEARIFMRNPGHSAGLVGDDAVGFRRHGKFLD